MTSTGGRLPNPVRALYEEVANDAASWTDAVFWYVLGVLTVVFVLLFRS